MDGFLVQQPFADLIAQGQKTWELRTQPVHLPRGEFYILSTARPHPMLKAYDPARLGVTVAIAESDGVEGPFSVDQLREFRNLHKTPEDALRAYARGRRLYAMKLRARPVEPRRYKYKPGAVTIIAAVELV